MSILYISALTICLAICKAIRDSIAIDLFKAYQQLGSDTGDVFDNASTVTTLQKQWHVMGWVLGATGVIGFVMATCTVGLNMQSIPATLFYLAFLYWILHDVVMNWCRNVPATHLGSNTLDKFLKTLTINPVVAKAIPGAIFLIITIWQNY